MKRAVLIILLFPACALAGVAEDFEYGSGGIDLAALDLVVRWLIFGAMCIFVGWVLHSTLIEMAEGGAGSGYAAVMRIARSIFLCLAIVLLLT